MKTRPDQRRGLARLAACLAGLALACAAPALAQSYDHRGNGGRRGPPPGARVAHPTGDEAWRGGPAPGQMRAGPAPGFDPRHYNGYWVGRRWHYGAPSAPAYATPGFRPGFTPWRPGSVLPQGYPAYVVGNYAAYHLRRPPYGFHWVQAGDEFLLVSISTGQVFDVVVGGY